MTAMHVVPRKVQVRMPAKINISLKVGPARADGFHELATVFHAVSLYDVVTVVERPTGSGISLSCGTAGVPEDAGNLAWRAAQLLATEAGRTPDLHISIAKGIPTAGGMAGGSADAAGALLAINELWQLGLSRDRLVEFGAELGSDVPFCVSGGTALGTGRGELLTPVLARGEYHWVIATAASGLSTPTVFRQLDAMRPDATDPRVSEAVMSALRTADARALGRALENDLQAPALALKPALKRTLDAGIDAGALGALMSGSGPTCVFLVRDSEHAIDVQVALTASGVAADVVRAHGPVRPSFL